MLGEKERGRGLSRAKSPLHHSMLISKPAKFSLLLILVATTVGCDRMTKHLAKTSLSGTPPQSFFSDMVRLEYAENVGGFLSIGASLPEKARVAIFTVGTAV